MRIGRIGVGVMVRRGSALPRIATVDEFRQSLLSAESVVYNRASTGIYLDQLFGRLGLAAIESKTARYPGAAAVLNHIAMGTGNEMGLGATTVIIEAKERGVMFVGPLPADIQNYTTYEATLVSSHPAAFEPARELLGFLNSATAKKIFAAAGIG